MSDDMDPLTDEQRARLLKDAEQMSTLEHIVSALQHILTVAQQALVAESWRFQNAEVTKQGDVTAGATPEAEPNIVPENWRVVLRDSSGEFCALNLVAELIYGNIDSAQLPLTAWFVDDVGRIVKKGFIEPDGTWYWL